MKVNYMFVYLPTKYCFSTIKIVCVSELVSINLGIRLNKAELLRILKNIFAILKLKLCWLHLVETQR